MTYQPGPSSTTRTTRPRLRRITVAIEDSAGEKWTTSQPLVTARKPRSTGAKTAGWIIALILAAGGVLVGAFLTTLVVGVVHDWWSFVPDMPYSVALKLAGISVLAIVFGSFLAEIVRYALGIKRLPDAEDEPREPVEGSTR